MGSQSTCRVAVHAAPRKTLVLDLDRTLIDSSEYKEPSISDPDFVYTDELGTQAKVWTRPFLRQFLTAVGRDFEVVLFTAAGARHADSVLQVIDPKKELFTHRLYDEHTTEIPQWSWVKDLSRLGRPLAHTLLVDDSTLAGLLQPCSLVPIRPFLHSNPKKDFDTALAELLRFLQDKVLPAQDVRHAIALHWNKITRQYRRRPLQPRLTQRVPAHAACNCTCHGHQHAHNVHQAPALQPPPSVPGSAVRPQCAAVQDGCGCSYSLADNSVVLAAAAYDMNAVHADEEDEEEGAACVSCGCTGAGGASHTDSHAHVVKGMRRSRRHLQPLTDAVASTAQQLPLATAATNAASKPAAATGAGNAEASAAQPRPAAASPVPTLSSMTRGETVLMAAAASISSPDEKHKTVFLLMESVTGLSVDCISTVPNSCGDPAPAPGAEGTQETVRYPHAADPELRHTLTTWPTSSSQDLSTIRSSEEDSDSLSEEQLGTPLDTLDTPLAHGKQAMAPTAGDVQQGGERENVRQLSEVNGASCGRAEEVEELGIEGRVRAGQPSFTLLAALSQTQVGV